LSPEDSLQENNYWNFFEQKGNKERALQCLERMTLSPQLCGNNVASSLFMFPKLY
jgi:hypothetical protein